jgi:hypothetical protein
MPQPIQILFLARISKVLAAAACSMAFLLRSARIPGFTGSRHTAHAGILRAPGRQGHLAAPRDAILRKCGLAILTVFQLTSAAWATDPKPTEKPKSFYRAPRSYSTTRDPDPPKYVKPAPLTSFDALQSADWLDIGMDYRFRYEYREDDIRRPQAGLDDPLLHRTRIYLGVHDLLDPFRFAVEMQDSRRDDSKYPLDDRDVNEFAVTRLQGELFFRDALGTDSLGNDRPISLRYGIQNFEFLDRRLLANNQWRNTANTFLGFRGTLGQEANDWSTDLLAIQPLQRDLFGWDEPVDDRWIYGLIGHWRGWSDLATIEPFYLALDQNQNDVSQDRMVHSPGLRTYGTIGDTGFDFDVSLIGQVGRNGTNDVRAWGGTGEIGYSLQHAWKPRVSAFYGYASGDRDPNDGEDNRFERFYGFGRPWSANDTIVFENIRTPKVRVELTPAEKVRLDFGYSWYHLASATDRFSGGGNVRDSTGRSGDGIGHEFDIRSRFQITKQLEMVLGYSYFRPGDFVRNAIRPGDTDFVYLEVNLSVF